MAKIRRKIPNPTYKAIEYSELGSWNPQANDGGKDTNELYVVKNLRMQVPGQYQQRSGYKMFTALEGAVGPGSELYSKGEYELFDNAFDLTFLYNNNAGKVQCVVLNRTTQAVQMTIDILTTSPPPKMVSGMQDATFFVYSIFGHGTYAIYPKNRASVTSTSPADWTIIPLGKDLAPTPFLDPVTHKPSFTFAPKTTGDMLVRAATVGTNNPNGSSLQPSAGHEQVLTYQAGLAEPPIARLAIQAQYWLTDDAVFTAAKAKFKLWEWSKNDPTNYSPTQPIPLESTTHLQTNGWGYRAVLVQQIIDVEGNLVTYRSQASVDFWVPNRYYVCAYLGYKDGAPSPVPFRGSPAGNIKAGGTPHWRNPVTSAPFQDVTFGSDLVGIPTNQDLLDLQSAYRKYYHATGDDNGTNGVSGVPNVYAAVYLGWTDGNDDSYIIGNYPYVIPASAYDLRKAPMTVFHWNDFAKLDNLPTPTPNPNFPANTIKIELYRTAFNGTAINTPPAKFGNGDPLFQPHLYGYVGSIEPDGTFTDDVQDSVSTDGSSSGAFLDFGKTPESYDGFLAGQFSGKVVREYNDKISIANTTSDYWVFAPSAIQQAVAVSLTPVAGTIATSEVNGKYQFFYQYEDLDGRVSDIQSIRVDTTDTGTLTTHIYFKLPLGYNPDISKVNIIRKDNSIPQYDLIAKVNAGAGYYIFHVSDAPVISSYPSFFKVVKTSPEPGGIIYSEGNQMFAYPFINIEVISKIYQITTMEVIIGRLWVWTERGLFYTLLAINQNGNTQGEEETIHGGNIGFQTSTKANKIVFFLSAHGLCFAESSGVVEFVANLQNEVLPYLNEQIPGVAVLTNAKRATLQWLGQRDELWLHFPSSVDLGGALPERTFILKLWGGVPNQHSVTAEFELINGLDSSLAPIGEPVIFKGFTDGTMYGSYLRHDPSGDIDALVIMNNDSTVYEDRWMGETIIEKRYPLGVATQKKKLRGVTFRADGNNTMWIVTGRPYPTVNPPPAHTPDYYGDIYKGGLADGVNKYFLQKASNNGQPQLYRFRTNGKTIETTAYIPAVRIVTEPDGNGNNTVTYYSLNAYMEIYDHP